MKSRLDRIINLLVDEVEDRIATRREAEEPVQRPVVVEAPPPAPAAVQPAVPVEPLKPVAPPPELEIETAEPTPEPPPPMATLPSHTAKLLWRLAVGLLVVIVLVNIPWRGKTLATAMPDARSLVIRNGLVIKEEGDTEIYVYQDGMFRWISSLEAFEMLGYEWDQVNIVEDGYLDDFEIGEPVYVLLKCDGSPHIYLIEGEVKRWILDIDTFVAEGFVWEDVHFVSCSYLRNIPDGETIPPGSGPPPQP